MTLIDRVASKRVSVVIATYNRAMYLREAIDSMLMQTRRPDEVIVVDDGSTDKTREIVRSYGASVRYVFKENGGRSSALNTGATVATGEYLWFFDDDDVAEPRAIECFLAAISEDADVDFVYGFQLLGVDGADGKIHRVGASAPPPKSIDFSRASKEYPFRTQAALLHRRCIERVGAFDPSYTRGQDYEFILRLVRKCRGRRVEVPVFIWRLHDGARGPASSRHDGRERTRVWMEFAGKLGHQLRQNIALTEYLPPALRNSPDQRRKALIHRLAVMGSKGLLGELLEDAEAAALCSPTARLPRDEANECWKLPTYEYFRLRFREAPDGWMARLKQLARQNAAGASIVAWIARGMLWAVKSGLEDWGDRRIYFKSGIRLLVAARHWPR